MGNLLYTPEFQLIQQHPRYPEWCIKFDALLLTKTTVQELHKSFCIADMDHSGTIDLVEMLTILDLEKTRFTERVFSIFDEDRSGKIDFGEFVLSLWNYCTLSRTTLGKYLLLLIPRQE